MEGETPDSPGTLYTDFESFSTYAGVDEDSTAEAEIEEHLIKQHLKALDSLDQLRAYLNGAEPL